MVFRHSMKIISKRIWKSCIRVEQKQYHEDDDSSPLTSLKSRRCAKENSIEASYTTHMKLGDCFAAVHHAIARMIRVQSTWPGKLSNSREELLIVTDFGRFFQQDFTRL